MIKLKTILKEGKVWERKFGEPLPTLDSVMKKHQQNQLNENMVSVLKPPVRKAKSTIYGYINLQYHATPLIKSMREFLKLVREKYQSHDLKTNRNPFRQYKYLY